MAEETSEPSNLTEVATSPQIALQRVANEIESLRQEMCSDMRAQLADIDTTLRSLEGHIHVGLATRLSSHLTQELAASFNAERARLHRASRIRRLLLWLLVLLLVSFLLMEVRSDLVSTWSRQTLERLLVMAG